MLSKDRIDDELLTRYLLGSLPEEETERLDEMSVTDDEIVWRLRAVENDLVDTYVRGEMPADAVERFKSSYLSWPQNREKVILANALLSFERKAPGARQRFAVPRLQHWAVAASVAAVALLAYVFLAPQRQVQPPATKVARGETATTAPSPSSPATVSFLLLPPTRGAGSIETIPIPAGTQQVVLRLQLESDDFPAYQGALRDLMNNEIVWRSESLKAAREDRTKTVSVSIPVVMLKQQNYSVELSGLPGGAPAELIGSYAFRMLLK